MNLEITDSNDVLLVAVGSFDWIYCEEADFARSVATCSELIHRLYLCCSVMWEEFVSHRTL